MDEDLRQMSPEELLAEAGRLRQAIRTHRDSSAHELCWHHPEMWALLPDGPASGPAVPDWPQFLRGCIRYRASLDAQLPDALRIEREFDDLQETP